MNDVQEPNEKTQRAKEPDLDQIYGLKYRELRNALYRHNPLGIGHTRKRSSYKPVIATILARWREMRSLEDLQRVIQEESQVWFSRTMYDTGRAAKHNPKYAKLARRVWIGWQRQAARIQTETGDEQQAIFGKATYSEESYSELYFEILKILHRYDPIGIAYLPDEYAPEASTILPRLREATSQAGLRRITHEEFVRWFDASNAGPESRYDEIAHDIWAAWFRYDLKDD